MAADPLPVQEPAPPAPASRARSLLLKRLADLVTLPESRVNAFERAVIADLLVEILRDAEAFERKRAAKRLAPLKEPPDSLVRLLLRDTPDIARELLENCDSLHDSDLVSAARDTGAEHRLLIASRKRVSEIVADTLIEYGERSVLETLLRNTGTQFSQPAIERLTARSRMDVHLTPLLLKRPELRPSSAYLMFWWADSAARRIILTRFSVSREILQDSAADVFSVATEEGWQDPLSRKALQFIERRQRNRAAAERSPFGSLEGAIEVAAEEGMTRLTASEIAFLAGVKPATGAKILSDPGGEPLAILCKSTGLVRADIRKLWRALKRPETDENGVEKPELTNALETYDVIAVDKAQTVLRYWNWSLSSALTPALVRAIRDGDQDAIDAYSQPQRAAMLAFAREFER